MDAGLLYARANRAEPQHLAVPATLDAGTGALVTSEAAQGAFLVACLTDEEHGVAAVLAQRLRTRRIATFAERAFRTALPLQGGAFTVLPADG